MNIEANTPMIRCGFPREELFNAMMRGGPVPRRVTEDLSAGGPLSGSMFLALTPDELIALRDFWMIRQNFPKEAQMAAACASAVDVFLRAGNRCRRCGGEIADDETRPEQRAFRYGPTGQSETRQKHCAECGERP